MGDCKASVAPRPAGRPGARGGRLETRASHEEMPIFATPGWAGLHSSFIQDWPTVGGLIHLFPFNGIGTLVKKKKKKELTNT